MKPVINERHYLFCKVLTSVYAWLHITLSYCVIGAVLATLTSAYYQTVHLATIGTIMAIFLCFGVYKAESARRNVGLSRFLNQLSAQKHRNY